MGDGPMNRLLEFLVRNKTKEFNFTGLAKGSKIGYNTLYKKIGTLLELGFITVVNRVGKSEMYQWSHSPLGQDFEVWYWAFHDRVKSINGSGKYD